MEHLVYQDQMMEEILERLNAIAPPGKADTDA